MKKVFSQLKIKSFDQSEGIIKGIATTPKTDKVGDIVEPLGASFTLPLPLHHEHDRKNVVGEVIEATATADGIEFTARVAKDVSDQIAEVWKRVAGGLIKFVSVGFRALEYEPIQGGTRFTKWAWDELSLTTIPANAQAVITATKAAPHHPVITIGKNKMTLAEQIASFLVKKSAALAAMDTLITKGITLAGDDETAYAAHEAEIVEIDKHLDRLKAAETRQAQTAAPIAGINVQVTDNAPKGTDFLKYVRATAIANGNPVNALAVAKEIGASDRVQTICKAAVSAGTTGSADFASLLLNQQVSGEFIDLLRPQTILGKLNPRMVPMNLKIPKQTTGSSVSWIGEGKPAPCTNIATGDISLGEHKIGAIIPLSLELLRRADPNVDAMVRFDLEQAIIPALDVALIDIANAGSVGVKPASLTNGVTPTAASGTTAAAVRVDVKAALTKFITANQDISSAAWIMNPVTALALSMMRNATTSLQEFPGITSQGGTFEGFPVITSTSVPGDGTAGYQIVLAVQNEILVAEGGIEIASSTEASIEMSDAPTNNGVTPTAAALVSAFQNGLVFIRCIRSVTWTKRRPTAVAIISAAKYA